MVREELLDVKRVFDEKKKGWEKEIWEEFSDTQFPGFKDKMIEVLLALILRVEKLLLMAFG